ncbi:MAG: PBP1A family penicillin-binding protein [Bauldia sp.]|nr:PBP1A family penicillin-binding protein [Bauldia sp.]
MPRVRSPFEQGRRRPSRFEAFGTRFDSSVERGAARVRSAYRGLGSGLSRFRVTGPLRVVVEVVGDGLTLVSVGAVLLLALALPAIEATRTDWRTEGDFAVTFLDVNGAEIGTRGIRQIDTVALDEMPDYLIEAVLATEDRRFYSHFGVDIFGTLRALIENLQANAVVEGGSTVTQQVAKLLFLSNERTLERKIKEAFIAVWLNVTMTKDEILKLYLDHAYMGGGTFGVAAASEFYFGKPVQEVSLAEAAMLAGLFQAPTRYAPHVNLPAARARANEVLTNLVEAGYYTEGQVIGSRRSPAVVVPQQARPTPDNFLDWAYTQVQRLVPEGDRTLLVHTTIDIGLQQAAEEAIQTGLRQSTDRYTVGQGAMVAVDPDGAVRAMVGGRDYGESQFNRATNALRQPGSSFKPFVYATAFMNGYTPMSVVADAPITIGDWSPQNFSGTYAGAVTLTTALVQSINTVPVRLAQDIGREAIVDTAHRMGITSQLLITRSLPLGSSEVSVIDMAGAYAAFANGGFRAVPYGITRITDSSGTVVYDHDAQTGPPERVLPPGVVADMNQILVQVPLRGTGRAAQLDGIPTAGKTGTTNAFRDAWFVGFTGNLVAAVWFGNDNYESTGSLTGGTLPAQTWNQFMTVAHQGVRLVPIPFIEDPAYDAEPPLPVAAANVAVSAETAPLSRAVQRQLLALSALLRPPVEQARADGGNLAPIGP